MFNEVYDKTTLPYWQLKIFSYFEEVLLLYSFGSSPRSKSSKILTVAWICSPRYLAITTREVLVHIFAVCFWGRRDLIVVSVNRWHYSDIFIYNCICSYKYLFLDKLEYTVLVRNENNTWYPRFYSRLLWNITTIFIAEYFCRFK